MWKNSTKMVDINSTVLIMMLNVNGLNIPITRQRLLAWMKKDPLTLNKKDLG